MSTKLAYPLLKLHFENGKYTVIGKEDHKNFTYKENKIKGVSFPFPTHYRNREIYSIEYLYI